LVTRQTQVGQLVSIRVSAKSIIVLVRHILTAEGEIRLDHLNVVTTLQLPPSGVTPPPTKSPTTPTRAIGSG